MKKLFTVDDFVIALVAALGYGYIEIISQLFGWPWIVCIAVNFVVGVTFEELLSRIIFSKAVQKKTISRVAAYVTFLLIFLIGHLIAVVWMDISMIDYAVSQLQSVIFFTILGFIVNLLIRAYRIKKIREIYGDGSEGFVFDIDDKDIEEINQQNSPAPDESDNDFAVKTRTGTYVGIWEWMTIRYLGIPYAKPPVGHLRWKAPEPLPTSEDVFEAKSYGASAIQVDHKGSILKHHRQSEDCLSLNITISATKTKTKRPVLVLFHHGDFTFGGSADPLSFGGSFVEEHPDTVFVSFNYRLGILGFIDFSDVPGGLSYPDALNLGLLDQIAALTWIKENISAFGGDPEQITVLGFESGASSICLLAASDHAKGLFQRAFVFNGSPLSAYDTPEAARNLAQGLLRETQTSTMEELVQLSTDDLKEAAQRLWQNMCAPTSDGTWIPTDAYGAYQSGAASGIEFIIGFPGNETRVIRSFVGNQNYDELTSAAIADIQSCVDAPNANAAQEPKIPRSASSIQLETRSRIAERWNALSIYSLAAKLSEGGNTVHLMYWDERPLIENLGAGTVNAATALLGNSEASQLYGSVLNEDLSEVLQSLLEKFMSGKDLQLYQNEIKGIDEFDWEAFPMALVVTNGRIECDPIEDKLGDKFFDSKPEEESRPDLIRLLRLEYLGSWGLMPATAERE